MRALRGALRTGINTSGRASLWRNDAIDLLNVGQIHGARSATSYERAASVLNIPRARQVQAAY